MYSTLIQIHVLVQSQIMLASKSLAENVVFTIPKCIKFNAISIYCKCAL